MPEIEFTIDPTSGQLEMHVKGGPVGRLHRRRHAAGQLSSRD